MEWNYILFDLDGTLTDSSEGILNCVIYALEAAGKTVPDRDVLLQFIGPPLVDGFQEVMGMDHSQAVRATAKYRERYSVIGLFENTVYEGIAAMLEQLQRQGKHLALATGKPETYAVRILQHFDLMKYFEAAVGSNLDGTRNTKEEVIREALRRLNVPEDVYHQVIMVGDRRHDIEGARACGIDSLGVYYGFARLGELEKAGAGHIAWNVEETLRMLCGKTPDDRKAPSLSEMVYQRVDLEKAGRDLAQLAAFQRQAESAQEQLRLHQVYYHVRDRVETMAALAMFRHSADTGDAFYEKENAYYDRELPAYALCDIAYREELERSPYRSALEDVIGAPAFQELVLQKRSSSPEIVTLQQEENRLVSEYEKLLASAQFSWDEKTLSMAELGRYQTDSERSVRRRAWEMLHGFMQDHAEAWDDLYDQLVQNRTQQAQKLGHRDFVPLGYDRMRRISYGCAEIADFRKRVKTCWVPLTVKIQERRRKRLGLEKLCLEDSGVYFPEGNPAPQGTPEEILRSGLKMYREMSPETASFMECMTQQEMFDVLSRPGKRQGGYMEFLPEPRMPLIFANFNGTSADVDVITHECGHAFQGYLAGKDEIREHWDITMETAETHSMSMEFFTNPWMELFFGAQAERFRQMQLEDAICFIPYGCMVDEFQQIVYEYPELTKAQRHEVWRRLEKQYRPWLQQNDGLAFFEKGGIWQKQHHIYSSPFYYIDYCLAQLCALQYKLWMEKDREEAWKSYLCFCRMSARGFFADMVRQVGLMNPLENGCMEKLAEQLEKYSGDA